MTSRAARPAAGRDRAWLPPEARYPVAASTGGLAVGAIPLFLVGALSTSMGDDLGFGPAGTGAALAVFFAVAGMAGLPIGAVTDRIGAPAAMRVGATLSGLCTLAIGTLADSLTHVMLALVVGGLAIAFVDTGASEWFAATVPGRRQGTAFGIKEASVPAASLFAGLSLPLLASTFDWRVVFVVGALFSPVVWFVVPSEPISATVRTQPPGGRARWKPLVLFGVGVAVGTSAATAAPTFLVPAFEDRGWDASAAGVLLAVSSLGSILFRISLGRVTDRVPGSMWTFTSATMAVGAVGAALLALPTDGPVIVVGAFLVVALGWGWTGLAFHAVLTSTRDRPALGAGLVLGGLSLGGAAGPSVFGALADATSYTTSWLVSSVALALGGVLTDIARRWLRRTSPAVVAEI
ncbi:MAG: MFS transporter [Acidimicrobiales bacterium]|nr:MFS transporter [Acidimicrobiales bacterium]